TAPLSLTADNKWQVYGFAHPALFYTPQRLPPRSTLFPYTTLFRSTVFAMPFAATFSRAKRTLLSLISTPATRSNAVAAVSANNRSEEHTSELQSPCNRVRRLPHVKKTRRTPTPENILSPSAARSMR